MRSPECADGSFPYTEGGRELSVPQRPTWDQEGASRAAPCLQTRLLVRAQNLRYYKTSHCKTNSITRVFTQILKHRGQTSSGVILPMASSADSPAPVLGRDLPHFADLHCQMVAKRKRKNALLHLKLCNATVSTTVPDVSTTSWRRNANLRRRDVFDDR